MKKCEYVVRLISEDGWIAFKFPLLDDDLAGFVSEAIDRSVKKLNVQINKVEEEN